MLKGTLDDFTLPDIFRLLSGSRKTGRLDVERSAGQGKVYFRDGDVYFAESTISRELIGQKLVKARVLTDGQLMKALDDQAEGGGRRIGEILRASDLVTEVQLVTALRSQVEDAVFDLLRWDAGEFSWVPDETLEAEVSLSVSVENLIMEGSRRLDELAIITRKIPSEHAVVAMAPAPPEGAVEINITPDEWRVLVLVNGQKSVLDIAESVGSDVFATMRTLYGLAAAGLVHVPGHVVEEDDEPLPKLPPDPLPVVEEPQAEAEREAETEAETEPAESAEYAAVFEDLGAGDDVSSDLAEIPGLDFVDVGDSTPVGEPSGYHASAYDPDLSVEDFTEAEAASEVVGEVPAATEDVAEAPALEATDLPTSEWFDAPQPGDLTIESPSEPTTEGVDADPFVSEILGPESTAEQSEPVAEDPQESFRQSTQDEVGVAEAEPEAEPEPEPEQYVDKRAAVQELSDLFKQSEVENTPSFLVPQVTLDSEEEDEDDFLAAEPEVKRRVEDDEDITRGLISRLIDGVKGL